MVFLLSLTILQAIVMVQCFRTVILIQSGALKRTEGMLTAFGMMAAAGIMGFPLLQEYATVAAFSQGKPVSPQGDYLPLWFLGFGGVLAVAVFGLRLHRQRTNPNAGFFAVGANASGIMIGLYMLFVVADQLMFFAPPRQDAGMLNWACSGSKVQSRTSSANRTCSWSRDSTATPPPTAALTRAWW